MTDAELAQLLAPALRVPRPDLPPTEALRAAALGVGGVVLAGGAPDDARDLARLLHERAPHPLLVGASVERGAGERFPGLTALPPPAALASLGEDDVIRRAARIAAREVRSLGVNWALAPVCDLEGAGGGARTFGADAAAAAELAAEWVDACQAQSVLACAKHFPGMGAGTAASADEVYGRLLVPFRAAIDAGVASVLLAHLPVPALGPPGVPAALASAVVDGVLRDQLGFDGLAVADVRLLARAVPGADPAELAVSAVVAGCDLAIVDDAEGAWRALAAARRDGRLDEDRLDGTLRRRRRWAEWGAPAASPGGVPGSDDAWWVERTAERMVHEVRGRAIPLRGRADVLAVDAGGVASDGPAAETFVRGLRDAGVDARATASPDGDAGCTLVVALVDGGALGRAAPERAFARAALERAGAAAARAARDLVVVHFAPPRAAAEVPAPDVVCAWSADPVMQRAAARWLARR